LSRIVVSDQCYHPLFVFNQDGDVEAALLRNGNVHSADDWRSALEPVIERYREAPVPKYFRGDAAFAIPELYELLEAEGCGYVIRLKGNAVLTAIHRTRRSAELFDNTGLDMASTLMRSRSRAS
jgi:hypothetical protein